MARDLPHRPRLVRLTLASDTRSARFVESAPAEIFFLLSAAAQYTGAVVAVRLFDDASPPTIALFRVLSAAGLLMLFSLRSNHAPWTRHDLYAAASFGIATALMNLTFYLAIDRLPLGKSVTIEFIGPIAVAALRTKRHETPSPCCSPLVELWFSGVSRSPMNPWDSSSCSSHRRCGLGTSCSGHASRRPIVE